LVGGARGRRAGSGGIGNNANGDDDDDDDDESSNNIINNKPAWSVSAILAERYEDRQLEYQISWEADEESFSDTWEPAVDFVGAPEILRTHLSSPGYKPALRPRKRRKR
jgi:hypothetical protein